MATTIYATFNTEHDAERAAGALMDHGVNAADVSFIIPGALQPAHTDYHGSAPSLTDVPAPDPGVPAATVLPPVAGHPHLVGRAPTEVAPAPGYRYDAGGVVVPDPIPMNVPPPSGAALATPVHTIPATTVMGVPTHGSPIPTLAGDSSMDQVEADHNPHIIDNNRELPHAARGISTTTGRDAAKGAAEGAGLGVGLGILLGLAAVAIPGIGLVAGAGALVASLTAATAAAGVVAGGAYGFLNDMGLPPHAVTHLQNHLQSGGPVLSIGVTPAVPAAEIIELLEKYGATSAQVF